MSMKIFCAIIFLSVCAPAYGYEMGEDKACEYVAEAETAGNPGCDNEDSKECAAALKKWHDKCLKWLEKAKGKRK
jgi:hypothetical protein